VRDREGEEGKERGRGWSQEFSLVKRKTWP